MSKFCFDSKKYPGLTCSGTIERFDNYPTSRNEVSVNINSIQAGGVNVYEYLSMDVLDNLHEEAQGCESDEVEDYGDMTHQLALFLNEK